MPELDAWVTPEERNAARRLGALLKFAELGIPVGRIDEVTKRAQSLSGAGSLLSNTAKAIGLTSVVAGVPLGILHHTIAKKIREQRGREKELEEQSRFYRDAAKQISRGEV